MLKPDDREKCKISSRTQMGRNTMNPNHIRNLLFSPSIHSSLLNEVLNMVGTETKQLLLSPSLLLDIWSAFVQQCEYDGVLICGNLNSEVTLVSVTSNASENSMKRMITYLEVFIGQVLVTSSLHNPVTVDVSAKLLNHAWVNEFIWSCCAVTYLVSGKL